MTTISTHVLDTAIGRPARGLSVKLELIAEGGTSGIVGSGVTDQDGRIRALAGDGVGPGSYRVTFESGEYQRTTGQEVFYPHIEVLFRVESTTEHLHIPLLLCPYGYSTYRGS